MGDACDLWRLSSRPSRSYRNLRCDAPALRWPAHSYLVRGAAGGKQGIRKHHTLTAPPVAWHNRSRTTPKRPVSEGSKMAKPKSQPAETEVATDRLPGPEALATEL